MVGFEKVLRAVKVIKDQIQCRSKSLLNLASGYFRQKHFKNSKSCIVCIQTSYAILLHVCTGKCVLCLKLCGSFNKLHNNRINYEFD